MRIPGASAAFVESPRRLAKQALSVRTRQASRLNNVARMAPNEWIVRQKWGIATRSGQSLAQFSRPEIFQQLQNVALLIHFENQLEGYGRVERQIGNAIDEAARIFVLTKNVL